jgi:hypothetical protein
MKNLFLLLFVANLVVSADFLGHSGQKYKYDLSDPIDKIGYKMDLGSQIDDNYNMKFNRGTRDNVYEDRSRGQFGGGVKPSKNSGLYDPMGLFD